MRMFRGASTADIVVTVVGVLAVAAFFGTGWYCATYHHNDEHTFKCALGVLGILGYFVWADWWTRRRERLR
ncbi:MAG TPA: hypothetical protein VGX96_21555 [Candidatus Elarobacter sp.]|jgi:hypothetical protein|nr:hypothetical protein [Candidatus Elarobacter sp.]